MNMLEWIFPAVSQRQVNALAGAAQAAALTDELATTGQCNLDHYARNVNALLAINPKNDQELFGTGGDLNAGLKLIKSFCEGDEKSHKARYLAQILYLQKRLMREETLLNEIHTGIEKANRQLQFYGTDSDALALSLESLYQETLSTLGFRIQIFGNPDFLSQQRVAARVRTLLFSGVRFALLWRQYGGRSRQLILSKKSLNQISNQLIKDNISIENNDASN